MTGSAGRRGHRVLVILNDLIRFTEVAERLVARGRGAYDADEAVRLAAEAILHKIGEAVARLPDDFVTAHPGVAWRSMKATRNIVAHRHEQVDYQLIWNALAYRLPDEADRIRRILDGYPTQLGSDPLSGPDDGE